MSQETLGSINYWGFSPAIDLLEHVPLDECSNSEVNILIVGSGDTRHILKTISKLYKRKLSLINFYVIESNIELYARQILQMIIAFIDVKEMGIQDKTELFLELYGNTLVRAQTMEFVRVTATRLIRLITDPTTCASELPFLDIDQLKFKERDILESVFKIWRDPNPKSFDASLCWDLRLRQHLGVRYDAIPNVFDWDCSITLHDRGASIITSREYCHWRHKGVAFRLRDADYDVSNRTLTSGRVLTTSSGDKTVRLGYWGDIVCSPYLAYGILSDNTDLFKKANNQYINGASRVAEYNVSSMFYELSYSKEYKETDDTKCVATITEVDEEGEEPLPAGPPVSLPTVKITLLPLNALSKSVPRKERFESLFDLAYFSSSLVGELASLQCLPGRLRPAAKVVIETPRLVPSINNDQVDRYRIKIDEMCATLGLQRDADSSPVLEAAAHLAYSLVGSV